MESIGISIEQSKPLLSLPSMKSRRILYIVLLAGAIYYFYDAMYIMFIDYQRLTFPVFGYNIGRVPYVAYDLFIAASLYYLASGQLSPKTKDKG